MIIYLLVGSLVFGFLPDDFFNGTVGDLDIDEKADADGYNFGFFGKVISFLFVGLTINGLPLFLSLVLNIMNLMMTVMVTVWTVNKVRGVSG